jgi:hypothetical protein
MLERDGTHAFRKVDMCKWQMDHPEARVKSSLSGCTWRTYEEKEPRSIFIIFLLLFYSFSFFSLSLFFFFSFFSYFSFLLIIIFFIFHFFFCSSKLLQHNTYIVFVIDDVMTPPPCLNDARPRA